MQKNYVETFLGALVVFVTIILLWSFFNRNDFSVNEKLTNVTAYFQTVSGISKGTDVKLGGVRVGRVIDVKIDQETLSPILIIGINPEYKIPSDSTFAIKSEGIMGGKFVAIQVGTDADLIHDGQVFYNNQSSLDLESIVSQVVFGGEKK
jgi:phospholipid/cholesterol/gamma-HCH transport system substrate-binding protein